MTARTQPAHSRDWPPPGADRDLWAAQCAALSPHAQEATRVGRRWLAGDDTCVHSWLLPDGTMVPNPGYREPPAAGDGAAARPL